MNSTVNGNAQPGVTPVDSEIVRAVRHEIRTALTTMQVSLELLEDEDQLQGGEARTLVDQIKRSATWLAGLLENTQWAATTLRPTTVVRSQCRLCDIVEHAISLCSPLLARRRQRVDLQRSEPAPVVYGDSARLAQVLIFLLTNAGAYAPFGDTILVRTLVRNRRTRVEVQDHGPGIPPEEHERIFEQYARGSAGATRPKGMGLGLYMAKEFVEAHGGEIGVQSAPGQGATFWFELPSAEPKTA